MGSRRFGNFVMGGLFRENSVIGVVSYSLLLSET